MNLVEATAECQRWLDYLERQKEKSIAMQQIAGERMDGKLTHAEAKTRLKRLDSGVTVHDGARLAEAVKFLISDKAMREHASIQE